MKRTAREIIVSENLIGNKNINVKIGTVENRNNPDTVYINVSFWVKPTDSSLNPIYLKNKLKTDLKKIYSNNSKLKNLLLTNNFFPNEEENIFIVCLPENFNYNKLKSNYISIELYLHTLNVNPENKVPLNNKKETELFDDLIILANIIGNTTCFSETDDNIFQFNKKSK